jgi:tetratricopeptide (TPR) repeat protein
MQNRLRRAIPPLVGLVLLVISVGVIARRMFWKKKKPQAASEVVHWPMDKERPDPEMMRAMQLETDRKWEEALRAYDAILARDADNWLARGGRVHCFEELGRQEEAIAELGRLVESRPNEPRLLARLALAHLRSGRRAEARALAEKAVALRAELPDPYFVLAETEADAKKGVAVLEEYLARAWVTLGDENVLREVVDARAGKYVQRMIEARRQELPEGPLREVQAEVDGRWRVAQWYMERDQVLPTKRYALDQLLAYLEVTRNHGDPDQARFAKARQLAARLKEELRAPPFPGTESAGPAPRSK